MFWGWGVWVVEMSGLRGVGCGHLVTEVSGFGSQGSALEEGSTLSMTSSVESRVQVFGYRVSSLEFWEGGYVIHAVGFRVSGFGFRVSSRGLEGGLRHPCRRASRTGVTRS